jgi:hypothetical protein
MLWWMLLKCSGVSPTYMYVWCVCVCTCVCIHTRTHAHDNTQRRYSDLRLRIDVCTLFNQALEEILKSYCPGEFSTTLPL